MSASPLNEFVAVAETRHGRMLYNVHDRYIGRALQVYGEWAWNELALMQRLVQPDAVVLDVGANIGAHTLTLADAVGPEGRVWAFEPQRLVFQMLCANVALNSRTNVHTVHAAVGATPGLLPLPEHDPRRPTNFGGVSFADVASLPQPVAGAQVRRITLDGLGLERCDLIKIDVEGMEVDVLAGARALVAACQPLLFIENNDDARSRALIEAVLGLNYRAWWVLAPYFNPANHRGEHLDIYGDHVPEVSMLCAPPHMDLKGFEPVTGPEDDWRQAWHRMDLRD